jgi:flagellin
MNVHYRMMTQALERLSSGLRINRAADDPAGLAISEKLRAQVRGLNMASRNAQDGISLLNVADGALNETHAVLQRLRELAVQAANDTLVSADRAVIQREVNELAGEVERIATQTEYNTMNLIGDNPFSGKLHIGANRGQTIDVVLHAMMTTGLDIVDLEVLNNTRAEETIQRLDDALYEVSRERGRIGEMTNRLEHIMNVNTVTAENTAAAEARIRDADLAKEFMQFMKHSILFQFAQALLAQANQLPLVVLQLLR